MEESISRIISDSAFEQLQKLLSELEACDNKMQKFVITVDGLRKSLDNASGLKRVSEEYDKLMAATEKLNLASSEKLKIEKEIRKESEKVSQSVNRAREELKKDIGQQEVLQKQLDDLAKTMIDQQQKLQLVSKELKDNKSRYSDTGKSSQELKQRIGELMVEEAALKSAIAEGSKEFKNRVAESRNEETSIKAKMAQLSNLKSQYESLSESERNNSAVGGELKMQMVALTNELKSSKEMTGGVTKVVGNCEVSVGRLKLKFREMLETIQAETFVLSELSGKIAEQQNVVARAAQTHGTASTEYKAEVSQLEALQQAHQEATVKIDQMQRKAGEMKDIIADTNDAITAWSSDTANVDAVVTGLDTMVQGYTAVRASMSALGIESEEMINVFAKIQVLQQGVNALQKVANNLTKESVFKAKMKNVVSKIRLAYSQSQVKATATETAAETANTAATLTNTAAQTANAKSKGSNTTATIAAAAATGGLAAANTVATASSFSLVGALKAVGVAIKSIPVIGWMLAAVAGLAALGKMIYKMATAEKELSAEQKVRNELMQKENDIKQSALESVEKEKNTLDINIALMKTLEANTLGWNEAVKKTADALGVSEEWLKSNKEKVDDLAKAWYECKMQQALADKYAEESANSYLESEKQILNVRGTKKERNEAIDNIKALSEAEKERWKQAEHRIRAGNELEKKEAAKTIAEMKTITREYAASISTTFKGKAQEAAIAATQFGETLAAAQKESAATNSKQSDYTNFSKERATFVVETNRKIAELEAKNDRELYELKQQQLQNNLDKTLAMYLSHDKRNSEARLAAQHLFEAESAKLQEEYEQKQINKIAASNKEAIAILTDLNEQRLKASSVSEEQLTEQLIELERQRNAAVLAENRAAFYKEVANLDDNSAEYLAIKLKWDTKNEKQSYDSTQREIAIRKQGFDTLIKDIQQRAKDTENQALVSGSGQLDKTSQLQMKIDGIYAEIEAYQALKDTYTELGLTEEAYHSKSLELQVQLAVAQKEQHEATIAQLEAEKSSRLELASTIGGSIAAIGYALSESVEDEKQRVVIQQSLAMAQVLMEQAVAISHAVSSATKGDPYTIAIRIAAAVGAVVTSFISAKNAITQAKHSVSQANAYAEGTDYHKGGAAIVGETYQPELIISGNKKFVVDKPTFFENLPVGTKVIPLSDRPPIQASDIDLSEIINLIKRLENKSLVRIDVGENVYSHIVQGASQTRILNTQFFH